MKNEHFVKNGIYPKSKRINEMKKKIKNSESLKGIA